MRKALGFALFTLLVALVLFFGSGWWAYRASQQVPDFYAAAIADEPVRGPHAGDPFEQQVLELRNEVRRPGTWQAVFTEEEINGWLTVDLPEKFPHALPADVKEPRVAIIGERVLVGCRYEGGSVSTVFSLEVEPHLTSDPNVVALRIRKARAGALPIPLTQLIERTTKAARRIDPAFRWEQIDGDPVALITIPPDQSAAGNRRIKVTSLRVQDKTIVIAGETEEQPPTTAR